MAVVKRKREKRGKRGEKHVWIAFVDPCCGGCTAVLCTLASFSLLHFNLSLFCFVALCNATHCHTLCYCEHLRFLSRSLSLPSHAHTRTHTHTHCDMDLTSAFVSLLLLLLLLLLSLWCAQPGYQQHWGRRSSGDCRGAEEQQHAAGAWVSAQCVDLGWWMRLCLW